MDRAPGHSRFDTLGVSADRRISGTQLATLLRDADELAAASAAEASGPRVVLAQAQRDELLGIYGVRKKIQADAARPGIARRSTASSRL